jgi:PTH2 family peptidyl-tRNA hydrolase
MSAGKMAAQVAHASMAYFTRRMTVTQGDSSTTEIEVSFATSFDIWKDWLNGIFTKTICEAKNRNKLLKAKTIAEELGMIEDVDFFLIKDSCLTELEPEEVDEDGVGRTLTCIGFKPLPDEVAHKISKKYQLYK